MPEQGPIFLAGTDRSGIGLLGEMLSAHPRIFISRRTRFWQLYYERFGDLGQPRNLVAAIDEMMRYSRLRDLEPDRDRLLAELRHEAQPSYGALFALVQEHHLERIRKQRWGDKTLNAERYADVIFREYPTARMIHVIRDPRDRYASQAHHRNASRGKVGAGTALWRSSVRRAERNLTRYPDRYHVVRYEDLVARPSAVLEELCRFLDELFDRQMLEVSSAPRGDGLTRRDSDSVGLVTSSIGRFRDDLSRREIAFIQLMEGRAMRTLRYEPAAVHMNVAERGRFIVGDVPVNVLRMVAWWVNITLRERSGGSPPQRRIVALE